MSKIYIPAKSPDDWKSFLAESKHWKKGHSAMSLALCWQEANSFPEAVISAFDRSDISLFHDIEILLAIPEYQVPLPGGSASSQNDIFVLAEGDSQLVSITVEGKVKEPFGDMYVRDWYADPSSGKIERLEYLCGVLGLNQDDVSDIRYQLLHRTASAIIEARRFNAPNAMMMVHSFDPSNAWFEDYTSFAELFELKPRINRVYSASTIDGINLFLCWVKGDKKYLNMESPFSDNKIIVTDRICDCCGQHEIVVTNESGDLVQLKPGMKVSIDG